jgi:small-conductance mechanosensitive channel
MGGEFGLVAVFPSMALPNNLITTVTNMSRGFAQSVVDVGIAYRENIDEALEVMRAVGRDLRADDAFGPKFLARHRLCGRRQDGSAPAFRLSCPRAEAAPVIAFTQLRHATAVASAICRGRHA